MHTVSRHLLAEYYDCAPARLNNARLVLTSARGAVGRAGATIVGETHHQFSPQGVSVSILIAESHLSVHTWPEAGYAAADIYTCGDLDPRPSLTELASHLGAQSYRMCEIIRGLRRDIDQKREKLPTDATLITDLSVVAPSLGPPPGEA